MLINDETGDLYSNDTADVGPITPVDATPGLVPANDWWNRATAGVSTVIDAATKRVATQIAAPSGALSSNVRNYPPGSQGKNVQAMSTPGGVKQLFSSQALQQNAGALIAIALVVVVLIALARK